MLAYVIVASCGVYLWECAVMVAIAFKLMCKCVSVCAIKRGSTCRVGAGVLPKLHFCFRIMQATYVSSSLYKDSIHHASGAEWAGVAGGGAMCKWGL